MGVARNITTFFLQADDRQSAADREDEARAWREQKRIREEYLEDERDTYKTED